MTSTLCLAGLAQAASTATQAARAAAAANDAAADTRRHTETDGARWIHHHLASAGDPAAQRGVARAWLASRLDEAAGLPCDFPDHPSGAAAWIQANTDRVGVAYQQYLTERRAGAPRRYFSNKSHALHFLRGAAPTKLVDGAWLYGMLQRWRDDDVRPLIDIYIEELGNGVPDKNHVLLYRQLLEAHGIAADAPLPDDHYVQGAIQLAFGHCGDEFLPELVGFNLGYEQLPLHLLITAYELNELGVDPYYFTLHVTVDNAATGHAAGALNAMRRLLARGACPATFLRRMVAGMRLNELGAGTLSIIEGFDLDREVAAMLAEKSRHGRNMHSDYCRVGGRTVNEWLASPDQVPAFLRQLEQQGWIRRGEEPRNSRFWRLIEGERAEMFGVFSVAEQQLLRDWIGTGADGRTAGPGRAPSFRATLRSMEGDGAAQRAAAQAPRGVLRRRSGRGRDDEQWLGCELRQLEAQLATVGKDEAMAMLIPLMAPSRHHTAPGLMATRIFTRMYNHG
ncbi:iron-containing redox enzyme family protein [Pseudoduganella namucuonensis]|uniref:Iron-containing redox enzyme n=1 Tax=Pseudoduganella namucuonensis TaxID=1035707 RepID=A0A1I7M3E0_9BURK|nr:iron-containing redox enzyme family protein [Pseudoduganella namucuonensis]SFV16439.1 Iron-containing redox enzyme [Pseudoduganella namucuonensis]